MNLGEGVGGWTTELYRSVSYEFYPKLRLASFGEFRENNDDALKLSLY